ncbi:MAG: recombinase family protein, partial [Anaeroplasmataceae bacterium]|nr:recombinase family protein [Anaeroplasmataceae bacterium]
MQTSLNTALYCRLSREDDNTKDISSSISSQKQLLTSFAMKNNFGIYKTYIDDGYSGTNFNRPGFQEMLRDVEDNHIKIIIVKDLSRFGRNYLQTGRYLEEYFPIKRVRVIALNDNYDSQENNNDFTPFKNIINEWYAKDISKKVTSSLQLKQRRGEVPSGKQCLYGYMYDEKRNRIPNPETAPIVRYIIESTIKGITKAEIVSTLRKNKVYIPAYYNFIRFNIDPHRYMNYPEEKKYLWQSAHIERIIYSREYAGDLVVSKTKKYNFKMSNR